METSIGPLDVIAMLGTFITAFFMWIAWEIITGHKALGLLLAVLSFVATWMVADFVGADSPVQFLLLEVIVAFLLFRVANESERRRSR